jgi:hypothetical protein
MFRSCLNLNRIFTFCLLSTDNDNITKTKAIITAITATNNNNNNNNLIILEIFWIIKMQINLHLSNESDCKMVQP